MNPLAFVLKLIPAWGWLALGTIALASLTAWHLNATHQARKEGRAEIRALWDIAAARAEEAARVKDAEYRAKEKSDAEKLAQIQAEGDKRHAEIVIESNRARASVVGLRSALDTAARALRSTAAESSASTADCKAWDAAYGVQSVLLGRMAEAGERVSRYADETRSEAESCIRSYEVAR